MSYNKARAEKKWLKWKETEEKQLRELGVDEEIIQRLHTYDWEVLSRIGGAMRNCRTHACIR